MSGTALGSSRREQTARDRRTALSTVANQAPSWRAPEATLLTSSASCPAAPARACSRLGLGSGQRHAQDGGDALRRVCAAISRTGIARQPAKESPSMVLVDRRARRAKSEGIDAELLLRTLLAWLRGIPCSAEFPGVGQAGWRPYCSQTGGCGDDDDRSTSVRVGKRSRSMAAAADHSHDLHHRARWGFALALSCRSPRLNSAWATGADVRNRRTAPELPPWEPDYSSVKPTRSVT